MEVRDHRRNSKTRLAPLPLSSSKSTYNGNNSVQLEQVVESLNELQCKQIDWLRTPRKDVVNNIIVPLVFFFCSLGSFDKGCGIFYNGCMIAWEREILCSKFVDDWIDFDNRCRDSMGD